MKYDYVFDVIEASRDEENFENALNKINTTDNIDNEESSN